MRYPCGAAGWSAYSRKVEATVVFEIFYQRLKFLRASGLIRGALMPLSFHDQCHQGRSNLVQGQHEIHTTSVDGGTGHTKNSAVASSCAITVPPIFLMACTPIAPSLPVPVSTTAIARSP